jgi:hypothetical protein
MSRRRRRCSLFFCCCPLLKCAASLPEGLAAKSVAIFSNLMLHNNHFHSPELPLFATLIFSKVPSLNVDYFGTGPLKKFHKISNAENKTFAQEGSAAFS